MRAGPAYRGRVIKLEEIGGINSAASANQVLIRVRTEYYRCVGGIQSEGLESALTHYALTNDKYSGLVANARCGGPVGVKYDSAVALNVFYVGEGLKCGRLCFSKKSRKERRRRIKKGFKKHGWGEQFKQILDGDNNFSTDISDGEEDDDEIVDEQKYGVECKDYEYKEDPKEEKEDEEDYDLETD